MSMWITLSSDGELTINASEGVESYALKQWYEDWGRYRSVLAVAYCGKDYREMRRIEPGDKK